jgi:hypothetical protein
MTYLNVKIINLIDAKEIHIITKCKIYPHAHSITKLNISFERYPNTERFCINISHKNVKQIRLQFITIYIYESII